MKQKDLELPDLLWSCFINWLNTLEKVGLLNPAKDQNLTETSSKTKQVD